MKEHSPIEIEKKFFTGFVKCSVEEHYGCVLVSFPEEGTTLLIQNDYDIEEFFDNSCDSEKSIVSSWDNIWGNLDLIRYCSDQYFVVKEEVQ